MTVINACDYNQTKAATLAIADHHGPFILDLVDRALPILHRKSKFEIGSLQLTEGTDVTIVATGHLVWEAWKPQKL
jgi:transketolase